MLTNKELSQINNAATLLTAIKLYEMNEETTLYDTTGVTLIDIEKAIRDLTHIHTTQLLKKKQLSDHSNEYKKQHRKHANIIQNINNAKHKNNQKKLDYWTQKLKEEQGGEL